MAAECARADVRDERRVWQPSVSRACASSRTAWCFLDETYVNTKMTRLRGRSRKGQRLRMSAPSATGRRTPSSQGCAASS